MLLLAVFNHFILLPSYVEPTVIDFLIFVNPVTAYLIFLPFLHTMYINERKQTKLLEDKLSDRLHEELTSKRPNKSC